MTIKKKITNTLNWKKKVISIEFQSITENVFESAFANIFLSKCVPYK